MQEIKRRVLNLFICVDQLLWSIVSLGNSAPDETISAGCYRMQQEGKMQGRIFAPLIDFVFYPLEKEHCKKAYESEVLGLQSRRINKRKN